MFPQGMVLWRWDYVAEHGYFNGTDRGNFRRQTYDPRYVRNRACTVDGVEGNDQANPLRTCLRACGTRRGGLGRGAGHRPGCGDNRFAPERQVSRQEMAAFIARVPDLLHEEHGVTFQAAGTAPCF